MHLTPGSIIPEAGKQRGKPERHGVPVSVPSPH